MKKRFGRRTNAFLRRMAICVLVAASSTAALPAQAADDDAPAKAFAEARRLWDAKDAATALPLFQQAVAATGSPNARLYVARCLRETGKLAQAYEELDRTVRDARGLAESDERYAATRDTAAAELAILEGRIGKLVVALGPSLAGATVTLGGESLPADRIGKPVAVLPGDVRIVATGADGRVTERTLSVPAGTTQSLTLSAEATREGDARDAAVPIVPPPDDTPGPGFGVVRGLGIGVIAIGAGGFVMFGLGTVQADDELATLENECGAGPCTDPAYADVISSGKTAEIVAGVGLGVGIAGLTAGALMMIFGGPSEPEQSAWSPTPNGVRFRF